MDQKPVIAAIGHVALCARDVDAALTSATEVMGLHVSASDSDWTYLTSGGPHHGLQYRAASADGVDHIGLVADGPAALDEIRARLEREGIPLLDDWQLDAHVADGFAFAGPEDFVFEVYVGMSDIGVVPAGQGLRPTRFGHVNLTVVEPQPFFELMQRVFDMRASDYVAGGAFLRCNPDHHALAIMPGPGVLHHHAWQVQSIADLGHLGDLLDARGEHLMWGPVRHGAGRNIAAYFLGPEGAVVEYYADMEQIYDEDSFEPRTWTMEGQRWYSLWSPGLPEGFGDLGVAPAARQVHS